MTWIFIYAIISPNRNINYIRNMLRIIVALVSLCFYTDSFSVDNSIIAVVDGTAITKKELEDRKKIENYFMKQQNVNLNIDNKSIFKQLMNEAIMHIFGK
jgi:hypothetical protein